MKEFMSAYGIEGISIIVAAILGLFFALYTMFRRPLAEANLYINLNMPIDVDRIALIMELAEIDNKRYLNRYLKMHKIKEDEISGMDEMEIHWYYIEKHEKMGEVLPDKLQKKGMTCTMSLLG